MATRVFNPPSPLPFSVCKICCTPILISSIASSLVHGVVIVSIKIVGDKAYLVATDSTIGKSKLFVRKKIDGIDLLGGVIKQDGGAPQRIIFVSPNPITVTTVARYLAVAITGFEEIVCANTNPYAVYRFERIN